jgi:hypothetical protein
MLSPLALPQDHAATGRLLIALSGCKKNAAASKMVWAGGGSGNCTFCEHWQQLAWR